MAEFYIKRNDTGPDLEVTCVDGDGVLVPVTGSTVTFNMRDDAGNIKINAASANITDGPNGKVSYSWQSVDTDTAGIFLAEFEVLFGGGQLITFPNNGYITVIILEDVEDGGA